MILRMMLGLMLCWTVSANAAQSETQSDKMDAVKAEVAKVQTLIEKYNLDLKVSLKAPSKAKPSTVVISSEFAKAVKLKAFASTMKCDDGDDDVPVKPRPGHGGHHDDDDDTVCTPYCESRWSDGSCMRWGADKCGDGMDCTPYCEARWSDGSCMRWGADVCN